jgi:EAL domain-containing protein (putative c-di-GMP-specific phosphodiesterase class I)
MKIDRSFIMGLHTDERTKQIVSSTLQMARALDLRTVAEGVEDSATAADLVQMGVDVLQGYHLSKPLPPAAVEPFIKQWTSFSDVKVASLEADGA